MRIFVIGSYIETINSEDAFTKFCREFGKCLAMKNIQLILCSPFEKSVDYEIVKGIREAKKQNLSIDIHYPKLKDVEEKWDILLKDLHSTIKINKFGHQAPSTDDKDAIKYSWLYCQIQGISDADFVLCIGGKVEGASNLLLRIAEAQGKEIIPLPKFGGVGEAFFDRKHYQVKDFWGTDNLAEFNSCNSPSRIANILVDFPKDKNYEEIKKIKESPTFFISYSRSKPAEADYVEMILRRRNLTVVRDETDISASDDIPNSIKENIYKSDVFIAIWCKEYACSPWCYDELSIALKTHTVKEKALWIIKLDDTRMIHPKARSRVHYDVRTREELEGRILNLLGRLNTP